MLLIDDDEEDFLITESLLDDAPGDFDLTWSSSYGAGRALLNTHSYDVCLVDYVIGGDSGVDFVQSMIRNCPMILLTGVGLHDVDLAASQAGASDFLDKSNLTPTLLERAIRYAMAHSKALRDLAAQSRILETTLDSIRSGVGAFDVHGNLVSWNKLFEELVSRSEITLDFGRDKIVPSDGDLEQVGRGIIEVLSKKEKESVWEVDGFDGRTYDVRSYPLDGGGDVLMFIDVTAQKLLQRKALEAKSAAEAASEMKSAFLAKVSHELRTPLNGVVGLAHLIRGADLDKRNMTNLEKLIESANSLNRLIEDLLDIAVIEQGKFVIDESYIDVRELLEETVSIASAASGSGAMNVFVQTKVPSGFGFKGDGRRIIQILVHFLSNADRFAPGCAVTLTASLVGSSSIRFSVRDCGPGIARDRQTEIFERFNQLGSTITPGVRGFGLGLSIAKELAEKMGGVVGVRSNLGRGAKFWFELPLKGISELEMRKCKCG